jgi:hypothetical protein
MDQTTHQRLTRNVRDQATGKILPKFNLAQYAWYGSNALEKSILAGGAAKAADMEEAFTRQAQFPVLLKRR